MKKGDKKHMRKNPLIGVCIALVCVIVLASFSNVVGYQTVQSSNQSTINNAVNQKELLFQTIVDISNNKEIQRIILKSQMSRGEFPTSNIPVLTNNQLKQMLIIGLLLSKIISKSRIQSMVQQYQLINPQMQQEISVVIEKDATLNAEITQLSNSECDCDNNNTASFWHFPTICLFLYFIEIVTLTLYTYGGDIFWEIFWGVDTLGGKLSCFWYVYIP